MKILITSIFLLLGSQTSLASGENELFHFGLTMEDLLKENVLEYNTLALDNSIPPQEILLLSTNPNAPAFHISFNEYQQLLNLGILENMPELDFLSPVYQTHLSSQMLYFLIHFVINNDVHVQNLTTQQLQKLREEAKDLKSEALTRWVEKFLYSGITVRKKKPKKEQKIEIILKTPEPKERTLKIWATKEYNGETDVYKRGFTPKPGKTVCFGLNTPAMKIYGVKAAVNGKELSVLSKNVFVSTFNSDTSFELNPDHPLWDELVLEFIHNFYPKRTIRSFPKFLKELTFFITKKIEIFNKIAVRKDGKEIVCRHFTYVSELLFSKIMKNMKGCEWDIKIFSGNKLDSNFAPVEGHAWAIITYIKNGITTYWFFDAYNYAYAELKQGADVSDVTLVHFENDLLKIKLETDDPTDLNSSYKVYKMSSYQKFFYAYVKYTLEKFFNSNSPDSLYHENNQQSLFQITDSVHSYSANAFSVEPLGMEAVEIVCVLDFNDDSDKKTAK